LIEFIPVDNMPTALPSPEPGEVPEELRPMTNLTMANLSQYVLSKFDEAKRAKQPIEERLIDCMQRFKSQYSDEKLHELKQIDAPEIYIPLTSIKCRALTAWLVDVLFHDETLPYDIATTPVPDLPLEIQQILAHKVFDAIAPISKYLPFEDLQSFVIDAKDLAEKELKIEIEKYSKKLAEGFKKKLDDVLIEGGFHEALSSLCVDISIFPTAIIKGGILSKEKGYVRTNLGLEPKDKEVYKFKVVSPFNIYPSPYATGFEDYVIEVLNLLPQDLYKLKGLPGYNSDVIDDVLDRYDQGYRFHHLSYTATVDSLEENEGASEADYPYIDVLEFWGSVKGKLLQDYGLSVNDPNKYYETTIWMIENMVLKAVLNEDPLGLKPYAKASFISLPYSFWGIALPEVISSIQDSVNAMARAIVVNSVLASGPLIERNIDRISDNEPKAIIPWHMYDTHESAMSEAPAYRFNNIQLVADRLAIVMTYYMKMADETSGIPAYAHGDITVGGAGRTASGLSMLTTNATRGIKAVLRNIDSGIINPVVSRMYYTLVPKSKLSEIPDLKIRTKGTLSLAEREMEATRALELLRIVSNPIDQQLVGVEGRKYLLGTIAKSIGIDPDRIFGYSDEIQELIKPILEQMQIGQPTQTKSPLNSVQNEAVQKGIDVSRFLRENGR